MLTLSGLGKTYPDGTEALRGIDLSIAEGEIVAVLGGSGCGKSTLLRLVAGLDRPSAGDAILDGTPITRPHEAVGVVFQEPRLFPWARVADNVGFGLRHLPKAERARLVEAELARVGLAGAGHRWPRELSGGMAQRVSLARSLIANPRVLLLDEPFSALDALTRAGLQDHLATLWSYHRPTLILVTHDIEETLVLADRVVVLRPRPGRIDTVIDIDLARPRDRDSAAFEQVKRGLRRALDQSLGVTHDDARAEAAE
ncbi:ABC transporter ATP-binding protein [Zavarzinia compransoris]|uniref:Nitrate/sulfonate/bicarbonate ABC transporter ATP-binding protein n=1 Tax=Zavarzinia compransoris TaxID=1264899 RepID=A0A317DWM3_9PROT|nr:ABC transporter ATP-binding protein [Zavarzinia compransoris]PWR19118.1 nitrate/sulfonate/bicarbonate ABC transporter ATP-binding protein [Zavarzinia compransoris]TDP49128.1 sulfonate transport system ATP-binding protein [Zavarzinia compransoris]